MRQSVRDKLITVDYSLLMDGWKSGMWQREFEIPGFGFPCGLPDPTGDSGQDSPTLRTPSSASPHCSRQHVVFCITRAQDHHAHALSLVDGTPILLPRILSKIRSPRWRRIPTVDTPCGEYQGTVHVYMSYTSGISVLLNHACAPPQRRLPSLSGGFSSFRYVQ